MSLRDHPRDNDEPEIPPPSDERLAEDGVLIEDLPDPEEDQ